jgi:hypothetical protein
MRRRDDLISRQRVLLIQLTRQALEWMPLEARDKYKAQNPKEYALIMEELR